MAVTSAAGHSQYQSLAKIPGQIGYLVLSEDGAVIIVSDSVYEWQLTCRITLILFRFSRKVTFKTTRELQRSCIAWQIYQLAIRRICHRLSSRLVVPSLLWSQ